MLQATTNTTTMPDRAPGLLERASCACCNAGTSEVVIGNDPDGFVLCRECLLRLDIILSKRRQLAT
jgi:hypothetical protein